MTRSHVFLATFVTIALSLGGASLSSACSVPVFRYALELWPPDHFPLVVLHRGELAASDQELIDRLRQSTLANEINLRLTTVDVEGDLDPDMNAVWESIDRAELDRPLLVLQTPARLGPTATVLTLELTDEHVEQLLDSPARKEIARRLLEDHSVVWVLLESGEAEQDEKAFLTLAAEIARLEETLELPDPAAEDLLSPDAEPLKLIFSSMRVRRDDPAERAFVEMLLNVEPDLKDPELDGEPMVFPVFGRGRALYALVGQGIVPATIEDAARYLTGACQCTVKAENPGADLLMAVDWDRWVTPTLEQDSVVPPLGGLASFAEAAAADDEPSPVPPRSAVEVAGAPDQADQEEVMTIGPLARDEQGGDLEAADSTLGDRSMATPASASSRSETGTGPGLSAMLIVAVIGVVVLLAGVMLTRRDG